MKRKKADGRLNWILLVLFMISAGQILYPDSEITEFNGGRHRIKARIMTSLFTGGNASVAMLGNSISSISEDPASISLNPASAVNSVNRKLSLEVIPPFLINLNSIYDVNPSLEDLVDEIDILNEDKIYPDVDPEFGQLAALSSFGFSLGLDSDFALGLAYQKPLLLDMDVISNGISGIMTDNGGDDTTRVVLTGDLYAGIKTDVNKVDLAFACRLIPQLSLGAGISILDCDLEADLTVEIDGIIRRFGEDSDITQSFNNPVDAENFRNTLNDTIRLALHSRSYAPQFGVNYILQERFIFDAVFKPKTVRPVYGDLYMVKHYLGAVDPDGLTDEDVELFDQTLIEPSRMTYTNRVEYRAVDMELQIPGKLALAAAYKSPGMDLVLSYEKPLGNLLYSATCRIREDGREKSGDEFQDYFRETFKKYRLGFKVDHILIAGMNFRKPGKRQTISLGARIYFADQIIDDIELEKDRELKIIGETIIPSFSLGLAIPLTELLTGHLNLISFPMPLFRFSLLYEFR